jgi:hypothetical protein
MQTLKELLSPLEYAHTASAMRRLAEMRARREDLIRFEQIKEEYGPLLLKSLLEEIIAEPQFLVGDKVTYDDKKWSVIENEELEEGFVIGKDIFSTAWHIALARKGQTQIAPRGEVVSLPQTDNPVPPNFF